MRNTFIAAVLFTCLLSIGAFAQDDAPKVQVFGGYSLLHADTAGLTGPSIDNAFTATPGTFNVTSNYNGWNGEVQYNTNRWLGFAADFSGHYGTPVTASSSSGITGQPGIRSYSYLFGPVVSFRGRSNSRITPFVHGLFGANRVTSDASPFTGSISDTAFAMALGGGVDANLSQHFAVRLGQVDYLYTGHDASSLSNQFFGTDLTNGTSTHQNNIRFSTGVVFKF